MSHEPSHDLPGLHPGTKEAARSPKGIRADHISDIIKIYQIGTGGAVHSLSHCMHSQLQLICYRLAAGVCYIFIGDMCLISPCNVESQKPEWRSGSTQRRRYPLEAEHRNDSRPHHYKEGRRGDHVRHTERPEGRTQAGTPRDEIVGHQSSSDRHRSHRHRSRSRGDKSKSATHRDRFVPPQGMTV